MDEFDNLYLNKSNQIVFLNSSRLCGTESFSVSLPKPMSQFRYLGNAAAINIKNSSPVTNISISKSVTDKDLLWSYTGNAAINGCLLQYTDLNPTNVSFISGYLSSYNFSAQIGQIPQVSAEIVCYGHAGSLNGTESRTFSNDLYCIRNTPYDTTYISAGAVAIDTATDYVSSLSGYYGGAQIVTGDLFFYSGAAYNYSGIITGVINNQNFYVSGLNAPFSETGIGYKKMNPKRIGPASISLNISEFETNRVNSLKFDYNMKRIPVYTLTSCIPKEILLDSPSALSLEVELEVNDYDMQKNTSYPAQKKIRNLSFNLLSYDNNQIIQTYNLGNMELISENYRASANGNSVCLLNFFRYL